MSDDSISKKCIQCNNDFKRSGKAHGQKKCFRCFRDPNLTICPDCKGTKHHEANRCLSCHNKSVGRKAKKIIKDKNGYIYIRIGSKYFAQHRLVMESIINRQLVQGENVHHINGDRSDNRPENLELWVSNQPSGQRDKDLVAWAIQILQLYQHVLGGSEGIRTLDLFRDKETP